MLKATLENVESVTLEPGFVFCVDWKDPAGHATRERVTLTAAEEHELPGSRGVAHLVLRWEKGSTHAGNASVVALKGVTRAVTRADSEAWVPVAAFDCRGLEPTAFHPTTGFAVKSVAGTTWEGEGVDFSDDWVEYDEKLRDSVGVYGVEARFDVHRG